MRKRRVWALVAGASILVVLGVMSASGGADDKRAPAVAAAVPHAAPAGNPLPAVKHHPRVVIAATVGDLPPGVYAPAGEAQSFQPPSDAEVQRELHQLNVSGFGGAAGYINPFSRIANLKPERIDMGVDYAGSGPVFAIGSGTVFSNSGSGWPGGGFVGITFDSGRFAGLSYFIAESVRATVRVGQHVRAGQVVAMMYNGPSGIETGWATGQGDQPLALTLHQQDPHGDPGAWTSAAGLSFDRFLVSLGTPSGIPQGGSAHGNMPSRYP